MTATCKWVTVAILLVVFVGLMSMAGSIHVFEYLGALAIGVLVARLFFVGVCRRSQHQLIDQH